VRCRMQHAASPWDSAAEMVTAPAATPVVHPLCNPVAAMLAECMPSPLLQELR
jgi:hypothetical protein